MVYLFLAQGFEESEALVTADLLRRAGVEVVLCGVGCADGDDCVTGSHGISVRIDRRLEDSRDIDRADMLILPGGMPGVDNLWQSEALRGHLRTAADTGRRIGAICAAPLILGRLGLLAGRRAVCYPGFEQELTGARIDPHSPVCADGPFITGRAAGTVFDFALALIEHLCGGKEAEAVRASVHYHVHRGE